MDDQRLTGRLLQYWKQLHDNHALPDIEDFDTNKIDDLWPHCFLVSIVNDGGLAYRYEYMGQPLAKVYGRDLTGVIVDSKTKQAPGASILKKLELVVITRQPQEDQGNLVNPQGQMIRYRACFLPFGTEKKGLTHIVVGMSFRVF